jgi:GalNAc-alpha-(1->4)-GalNAc-alpha-(1->3)-diNAcBac-PP-undecaprenol alpha-1,4-N-acetyl-D-galactosaminyltransferase
LQEPPLCGKAEKLMMRLELTEHESPGRLSIGYLIGALGTGGSERQLTELAAGMVSRGHRVKILCYDGAGSLDSTAEDQGVVVERFSCPGRLSKVAAARRWTREFQPGVLHGFMKRASSLAVLANLPRRGCQVIASDFSTASYSRSQPALWLSLVLFSLADAVVTQTEMNRRSLGLLAPWLRRKTVVVRNGVDFSRFTPQGDRAQNREFRFVCVGSVYRVKNPVRVVEAVRVLRDREHFEFTVDWYGRKGRGINEAPTAHCLEAERLGVEYGLQNVIRFHGETAHVENVYAKADAILHPSLQEGFPNAVIEAMASGLPVVVSAVSDLPLIVGEADNGFVCDPLDPVSIAAAMESMMKLTAEKRAAMGTRSRDLASRWFGRDRFLDEYERLYRSLVKCDP